MLGKHSLHALEHRGVLLRKQASAWTYDCSSRDFSAHIAHSSLVMIRYNMLASIKRTLDYDTIGGLFGDMYLGVHELTVVEKIWAIIIEVVAVVSELIGADSDELTIQIIENDKRLAALREYAQTA